MIDVDFWQRLEDLEVAIFRVHEANRAEDQDALNEASRHLVAHAYNLATPYVQVRVKVPYPDFQTVKHVHRDDQGLIESIVERKEVDLSIGGGGENRGDSV
jgi:hypothetical protein